MDKYQLVVFGDQWDVYQVSYRELIDNPHVICIPTCRPNGLLGVIQRFQFNPRLNRLINIPCKSMWNPYYLRNLQGEKVCFLIMEYWLRLESGIHLFPFLRAHYPQAKIVCFTQDMMDTIKDHYTLRPFDVQYVKQYVDLFVSYDTNDAKTYQVDYHPTVFSPLEKTLGTERKLYDLYFLGRDKGRLKILLSICQEAKTRGLKCHFVMLEIPAEDRVECEGIVYADAPIPYEENLRLCTQSKCVIELLQQNASGPTYRTWEAISLNVKLLTNNQSIKTSQIYDPRYISVFQNTDDLDWSFVESEPAFTQQNPFQEKIRPESLVRFIEEKLQIQINR
ncbi:MAG: hypothetical protein GXY64_05660 [Bacteroidales bacterium]|nr:hypothetical protein [Bacteroidales bacterium]